MKIRTDFWLAFSSPLARRHSKSWLLISVWILLLLPLTGCYRFGAFRQNAASDYPTAWSYRRQAERGADLVAGCIDATGMVRAIADHGSSLVSHDGGETWSRDDQMPPGIHGCLLWNERLVGVGDEGLIYLKANGSEWKPVQTPRVETLKQVASTDQGLFVGGANGAILWSKNGNRWQDVSIDSHNEVLKITSCASATWAITKSEIWSRNKDHWTFAQSPLRDLTSLACGGNQRLVVIVNREGKFGISRDRGQSWQIVSTGYEARYPVLDTSDDQAWIAAGGSGVALYSQDQGNHWSVLQSPPLNVNLLGSVRCGAKIVLFGQKGTVLIGGAPNGLQIVAGRPLTFSHLFASHALQYGDGGMIQSLNSGAQPVNIGTRHDITGMAADGTGTAWAVTNYAGLYATHDFEHWTRIYESGVAGDTDFKGIAVSKDGRIVVAAATDGKLFTFLGGGATPIVWQHSLKKSFRAIAISGTRSIAVGDQGERAWSDDDGLHWHEVTDDFGTTLSDVVLDGTVAIAVGDSGEVLRSTNAGRDWTEIGESEDNDLHSVACMETCSELVTVGENGSTWTSNDMGKHWDPSHQARVNLLDASWAGNTLLILQSNGEVLRVSDPSRPFTKRLAATAYSVLQDASGGVWLGSKNGVLLKSIDGGMSWETVRTPLKGTVSGLARGSDSAELWSVGTKGSIAYSPNEGAQWQDESLSEKPDLNGVVAVFGGVVAVGDSGLLLRKPTGGNWTHVNSGTDVTLLGLTTDVTGKKVWAVGSAGTILFSDDAGRTWKLQTHGEPIGLKSIAMMQTPFGVKIVATGDNGSELLSLNEGKTWYRRDPFSSTVWSVIAVPSTQQFWAVTADGMLLNSNDYGEHWSSTDLDTGPNSLFAIGASNDGSKLYVAGEGGVFERLDRLRPNYLVQNVNLDTDPKNILINVVLSGYEGTAPTISLRMARDTERYRGLSEELPISIETKSEPGRVEYSVKSPVYDVFFRPGETVWFTPCLTFKDTGRCIPMNPAVVRPLFDIRAHWKETAVISFLTILVLIQSTLLWIAPRRLLTIHKLISISEELLKDKIPFGGTVFQINKVLLVPLFAFSARSLDAWVRENAERLREDTKAFSYVSLPIAVEAGSSTVLATRPEPKDLRDSMSFRHLSIQGPGGAGKTSLARQIQIWLSASNEMTSALGCRAATLLLRDRTTDALESIRLELQERLGVPQEDELILALLRKGRLVIILDGISERPERGFLYLDDLRSKLLARCVVSTARLLPPSVGTACIRPQSLQADALFYFMLLLLQREQGEMERIEMKAQLEIAERLEAVVNRSGQTATITPLLVETFVSKAVTLLRSGSSLEALPKTVGDAYLDYVREMVLRGSPSFSPMTLLYVAKSVASACLENTFVPGSRDELVIIKHLDLDPHVASSAIKILLDTGLLIRSGGSTNTDLRFALDPVAEYCAASFWYEVDGPLEWLKRKCAAEARLPQSQGILRAMQALEDVDPSFRERTKQVAP